MTSLKGCGSNYNMFSNSLLYSLSLPLTNMLLIHNQLFQRVECGAVPGPPPLEILENRGGNANSIWRRAVRETTRAGAAVCVECESRASGEINTRRATAMTGRSGSGGNRSARGEGVRRRRRRRDDALNGICGLPSEQAAATDPGSRALINSA